MAAEKRDDDGSPRQAIAAEGGVESTFANTVGPRQRDRSASFLDRFSQAREFWNSQTPVEQSHIVSTFEFELGNVEAPALRQRVVEILQNVDRGLAERVVAALGIKLGNELATLRVESPIDVSPALSMQSLKSADISTRTVAALVADGFEAGDVQALRSALEKAGARLVVVAPRLGPITPRAGSASAADHSFATVPSAMFDAVAVPGGKSSVDTLVATPSVVTFVQEAHRNAKALALGANALGLLQAAGIDTRDEARMVGVISRNSAGFSKADIATFIEAIAADRHWDRVV